MARQNDASPTPIHSTIYQIRIQGRLGSEWADWFDGMHIVPAANGQTLLIGRIVDQAALYGILRKVRDLGIPLLSVGNCAVGEADPPGGASNMALNHDRNPQ